MRQNNWTLGAIASLVVAFMVFTASTARADESNDNINFNRDGYLAQADTGQRAYDPPTDEEERQALIREAESLENRLAAMPTTQFDNKPVDRWRQSRLGLNSWEIILGGGVSDTLNSGREYGVVSRFGYGRAILGFAQINCADEVLMRIGAQVSLEGAFFESRTWRGRKLREGGGLDLSFFDIGHGDNPQWSITLRPGIGYDTETGYSRNSRFKLDHQSTLIYDGEYRLTLFGLAQYTGDAFSAYEGRQVIRPAWFHASELGIRTVVQLMASRHESFPGRDTNNSRYEFIFSQYIRRGAWAQGEWAFGVTAGVSFHHAAGYKTVSHDNIVTTMSFGLIGRLQVFEHGYVYLNTGLQYEERTGRLGGNLGISIDLLGAIAP